MFSIEQRKKAIELFIKYDHSCAAVIRELGYPGRHTLRSWWKDYERLGEVPEGRKHRKGKYSDEQKRAAVDHYLEHGKCAARTVRKLGYPSRQALIDWVDELAPGERAVRSATTSYDLADKAAAVMALEAGEGSAKDVAGAAGVTRETLYHWRKEILGGKAPDDMGKPSASASIEELEAQVERLRGEVRSLQLQKAVLEGTLEIVKKDPGTDPKRLTNREKALLVDALRSEWRLRELLEAVRMAKSSYEYAARAIERGESARRAAARRAVVDAFEENRGRYGYRRIMSAVNSGDGPKVGEWTVRGIMREEGLEGRRVKKKRGYSSYEGETSEAPENLLRREDGTHDFRAGRPNEVWVTDVTEFRIPAGKVYLSPIIDCFDGMPLSWTISTSPNAEMANSSLEGACGQLAEGERPKIHSDRGGHYRWPGWIEICKEHKLVRSMSRKGCSPDNARAEGFFGRLKVEFFCGLDWEGVSIERFIDMLDEYMRWYREKRIKSDLGYRSPLQYRKDLGLLAA